MPTEWCEYCAFALLLVSVVCDAYKLHSDSEQYATVGVLK